MGLDGGAGQGKDVVSWGTLKGVEMLESRAHSMEQVL